MQIQDQTLVEVTWYAFGAALPSGRLPRSLDKSAFKTLGNMFRGVTFAPTTYEAAQTYLRSEIQKPAGERDLNREMCLFVVMAVPKNQEVAYKSISTKALIDLPKGEIHDFSLALDLPVLICHIACRNYGCVPHC